MMRPLMLSVLVAALVIHGFELLAHPIYENVADKLGLSQYQNQIVLMKDSVDPQKHYLIPAKMGVLRDALAGELPRFILDTLNLTYEEFDLGGGKSEFIFFLVPSLKLGDLAKASQKLLVHNRERGVWISEQTCYRPDLALNSIPSSLIENVQVFGSGHVLAHDVDPLVAKLIKSNLKLVPPGYLYKMSFETTNPQLIRSVLKGVGFIGNATFKCLGYTADMDVTKDPITIEHSVPLNARF